MMDFEDAAQRLARDQQKLRGRTKTAIISAKAKREADYRKKQQEQMRHERLRKQKQQDFMKHYMTSCDRSLGVKSLSNTTASSASAGAGGGLTLTPTSIHGDGDKIALPPSVLEYLTTSQSYSIAGNDDDMTSSPWMFRIGILNPNYSFPQSVLLQTLKPNDDDDDDDEDDTMHDDDDEDHGSNNNKKEAYLDELAHKYIAHTHGTVVEFTQEEGHVGLPAPIAAALLAPKRRLTEYLNVDIPVMRTKDPSMIANKDGDNNNEHMQIQQNHSDDGDDGDDDEKTPGHVAYGAFDIPNMNVEISMVKLPKGKACTLTPTHEAIQNGFYNLQDVKLVLEQSLIRTRATLSVGDTVHTWHRGVKFDLLVSKVVPDTFAAVSCINTDIEVELGQVQDYQTPEQQQQQNGTLPATEAPETRGQTLGSGRTLSSSPPPATAATMAESSSTATTMSVNLLPEPPLDQTEGICTVQIRSDGVPPARRRFDVQKATLQDLFAFATSISGLQPFTFCLVTRFPRRVFALSSGSDHHQNKTTMRDSGIQPGQELFMVERL